MFSKITFSIFSLVTIAMLSIACGSGGGASSDPSTATISGSLDFSETSLSKARSSANTSGNVTLINLATNVESTFSFTGNTFTANVVSGDYEIQALRNDNMKIKLLVANVSSLQSNNVEVNIDSTVIAQYVELYDLEINELGNVKTLLSGSSTTLASSSNTISDANRQASLIILALKKQLQNDISQNVNIFSSTYNPSETSINTFSTNVVSDILATSQQIMLAGNNLIVGSANINSFNPSSVDFDGAVSSEAVAVIGGQSSAGSLSLIDVATGALNQNLSVFEVSDLAIFAHKRKVHVLGKYSADFIDRYDIESLNKSKYKAPYSTLASSETSTLNPHSLIFSSKVNALLTRYGSAHQWIVNPSATSESKFLLSTVDLSVYDTNDGIPEFSAGVFAGGNYFIGAQRLDRNNSWVASSNGYVSVLSTDGTEINTGKAAFGSNLLGIELPARNPTSMVYSKDLDKIFVQCIGQYGSTYSNTNREFTGGIVTIDPHTFETSLLIDDDAGLNESSTTLVGGGTYGGLISKVTIVSATKGYIVIYSGWQDNDLRSFNPTTGVVSDVITDVEGVDIADMKVDSQNRLWLIANTFLSSEIRVLNTTTDTVEMTVTGFDVPPKSIEVVRY